MVIKKTMKLKEMNLINNFVNKSLVTLLTIVIGLCFYIPVSNAEDTSNQTAKISGKASKDKESHQEQAKDFINSVASQVIEIASSKSDQDSDKEKKLNDIFVKTVDINWIAKFVCSRYWREATKEQQDKYLKSYTNFLIHSYVPKFKQYTGQKFIVNKSISEDEGDFVVDTTISENEGKSYNVSYKVRKGTDGKFKIFDIVAEGVSLITTQRSDFSAVLARENIDGLVAQLDAKAMEAPKN